MPLSLAIRNSEDWRAKDIASRWMLNHVITPTNTASGANILGLRKLDANPDVYISRIRLTIFQNALSAVAPVGWKRATSVANGATMTASDVPDIDSQAGAPTLEVHTTTGSGGNLVSGTKDNQYILTHPGPISTVAVTGGGLTDDWTARDLSERIRLTGDEGLILDWGATGDTDTRFHLLIVWTEV